MSLDMIGHIDAVFVSIPATRTAMTGGGYVDGIFVPGTLTTEPYVVNIQPVSERELDFLSQGGERIVDPRRIYINDGNMQLIDETGEWNFIGQRWKAHKCDNRYWRNYCKVIVSRIDDQ
jgi:hypothetical protein